MSSSLDPTSGNAEADSNEDCPSRVGEVLDGRYELVRKIGEGGMGEVYEARHRVLGRRFAVKLLHPELVRSGRMLRRFSRESLSASRIESDHVVAVVDCGHLPDGAPYFVMDYLRGQDLRSALRENGQFHAPRAVRLAIQVCHGLRAAHELGLVHRDLKPENIFIQRQDDGRECAKILDFGVVQTSGGNSTAQSGALIGTLRYMAPEQACGEARVDQRADLYAVGAILYECLTGVVPHPGRTVEAILFHVMNEQPAPLRDLRPGLDASLETVVRRSLEREPQNRFQSASEFADALKPHARTLFTNGAGSVDHDSPSLENTRGDTSSIAVALMGRAASSRRSLGATRRTIALAGVALLCGATTLHLLHSAWLPGARPQQAKRASPVAVSAAPLKPPFPTPDAPKLDTSSSPPRAAVASATSERPPAPERRSAARAVRLNAAPPQDDYRANLDWKNPYGPSGPLTP